MATKQSREDFRKQKELEEARKAGTAPAEQDEDGKDINPHIPQYISEAPWYLKFGGPTLKHQREDSDRIAKASPLDEWVRYKKGVKKDSSVQRKFRKGACENCGAMTHKTKDCVERPRQKGAKHTNKNICKDEYIPEVDKHLGYAGRHDRWRGYNPAEYQRVIDEHAQIDKEKRKIKERALREGGNIGDKTQEGQGAAESSDSDSDGDEDAEDKYAEEANMIAKFDAKNRVSVRNLRIREDTAKYLRNLDVNSAYYDPKTRTMRSNPYQNTGVDGATKGFVGDNFIRYNTETTSIGERQLFAWDSTQKGEELHAQADPTLAEMMHKKHKNSKEDFKTNQRSSVLDRYGGVEHLDAPPKELLMAQSEMYVEYNRAGRLVKGHEHSVARSKYEEDVHPGNHKSIWGSFWNNGNWGFACCHSIIKESWCSGEAGIKAFAMSDAMTSSNMVAVIEEEAEPQKSMAELHKEKLAEDKKQKKKKRKLQENSSESESEDEEVVRAKKIKEAMKRQEKEDREAEAMLQLHERDRKYGSVGRGGVDKPTEEEMEAFRLRQSRQDDPLSNFGDKLVGYE